MKSTVKLEVPCAVSAIILAAGEGRRFGGNKQLARVGDARLIERVMNAVSASHLPNGVVVLGARHQEIAPFISSKKCRVSVNNEWQKGIGSSIKCGFRTSGAFEDKGVQAVFIAVADQPHMNAEHIDRMIEQHLAAPTKIIASGYSGNLGTPAIFPRNFFLQLANIPDGVGAKSVIHSNQEHVVAVGNELLALDIDTPKDLENWVEESEIRKPGLSRTDYAYKR